MTKKRLTLLSGRVLVVLLLAGLIGVSVVFAQEPTPPACPERGDGPGFLSRRGGFFPGARGGSWTMFDAAADALGLTPEELFAELHAGESLEEVAEAQGIEMETVRNALQAARLKVQKGAIEQAVEDGRLSQEQADWMLEGVEKGFFPAGRGFRGRGFGRGWAFDSDDV